MQKFQYSALSQEGERIRGDLEANSLDQASRLLKDKGLIIINLKEKKQFASFASLPMVGKVPVQDKIVFTRQLATMISSGLAITQALQVLQSQSRNKKLQEALGDIVTRIDGGSSLRQALEAHPAIFNPLYLSLVRAGEASGKLDEILERLADNLEADHDFKSKTRGALIYPAVIVVVMFGVLALMVVFVIPKLSEVYDEIGAKLPLTTRLLLKTSDLATRYWWVAILLLIGAVYLFKRGAQTEKGRYFLDDLKSKMPVLGNLFMESQLTSFTRTLSLLVKSGIPIIQALEISRQTLDNVRLKEAVSGSIAQVEKGKDLASSLRSSGRFPPILPEMIAVGEQTGKLDEVLYKVSQYFENEATNLARNLSTALEPIIMVVLGVLVGFLVISLILPIYSLISQF